IFDADIGTSGDNENSTGLDRPAGDDSMVTYSLRNPAGGVVASATIDEGTNGFRNNSWTSFPGATLPIEDPAAWHWEVRVDMLDGDMVNAYGVRAFHTTEVTGDTELNVYYEIG